MRISAAATLYDAADRLAPRGHKLCGSNGISDALFTAAPDGPSAVLALQIVTHLLKSGIHCTPQDRRAIAAEQRRGADPNSFTDVSGIWGQQHTCLQAKELLYRAAAATAPAILPGLS